MGTPQQRYLPRTIASDRVDDAAPSVAQHERTLAQSAAHLVALAHVESGVSGHGAAEVSMESADRTRQNLAPTPLELREPPDQNASAAHARTRAHGQQKLNLAHFGAEFRAGKRFQAPTRPV